MYLSTGAQAKHFVTALRRKDALLRAATVWIAAPFPLIPQFAQGKKSVIKWGAQTVSSATEGAHTGEVSALMLKDIRASFAIVGHSERRAAGESDTQIAAALRATVVAGLTGVLCVGETQRDQGGEHFETIVEQLTAALASFPSQGVSKLIIAYEPVWAIGKTAADAMKPGDLQEMTIFIRKTLTALLDREAARKIPILYGGSVEGSNARSLLEGGYISGFLVGHASAELASFTDILAACKK